MTVQTQTCCRSRAAIGAGSNGRSFGTRVDENPDGLRPERPDRRDRAAAPHS